MCKGLVCDMMECVRFGVVCGFMGLCKVWCGLWHDGVCKGVVCGFMVLCRVWCGLWNQGFCKVWCGL